MFYNVLKRTKLLRAAAKVFRSKNFASSEVAAVSFSKTSIKHVIIPLKRHSKIIMEMILQA